MVYYCLCVLNCVYMGAKVKERDVAVTGAFDRN